MPISIHRHFLYFSLRSEWLRLTRYVQSGNDDARTEFKGRISNAIAWPREKNYQQPTSERKKK